MTNAHPNVEAVNRMTEAIFSQDHDTLAKIFTDDMVFHLRGPDPMAGDHSGVGGFLGVVGSWFEATNGQIELEQQFCVGTDGWAAEWEHATLARKGKRLESQNAFVYRFEDERIAEMWMFLGTPPDLAASFFA
jgi:ketosteroid isomerase-like protein